MVTKDIPKQLYVAKCRVFEISSKDFVNSKVCNVNHLQAYKMHAPTPEGRTVDARLSRCHVTTFRVEYAASDPYEA